MAEAKQGNTYAQVVDGRCHWIFTSDDLPEWNENDITVVDVTGKGVKVGDLYDGTLFSAPVLDLSALIAGKLAVINIACENAIASIQAGYPDSEVLSWPKQEAEARSYAADSGAATPLLNALSEARGIDKAELARRVILKADAFAQYSGAVIGERQALEDALNALPADATVEQIAAITW